MGFGDLIDRIILPLAPGLAERRAKARLRYSMLATYAGATKNRRDSDWKPKNKSAEANILPDCSTLNARARALVRDNAHARSAVKAYVRNVVGKGITPISTVRFSDGADNAALNREIDRLWQIWSRNKDYCDVEGRKTIPDMQRMLIAHLVEAGEFIFIESIGENPADVPDLQLQAVEAEQLDTSKNKEPSTGNEIRLGVEVTKTGRPVAYHIHSRTPDDFRTWRTPASERIPARRVHHIFIQDRPGQTRGVTWFAPVIQKLRDLAEYDSTQLWTARLEACIGLLIENQAGTESGTIGGLKSGDEGDDNVDADGNRELNFRPGMVFEGAAGEKLTGFAPTRPGGQYDPFIKAQLRAVAAGMDISYEQVARDFTAGNFSSQRQTLLEDRRTFEPLQEIVLDGFLVPVRGQWILSAVLKNLIPAPGYFSSARNRRAFAAADWQPHGWSWIDPAKQAAAALISLKLRIATRRGILNEMGENWREVIQQISTEEAFAEGLGVTFPENVEPQINDGGSGQARPARQQNNAAGGGLDLSDPGGACVDPLSEAILLEAIGAETVEVT